MAGKEDKGLRKEPDFARGLHHEDEVKTRPTAPDFARGQEHRPGPGDKYDTDYARGLDHGDEHKDRPDYARGLTRDQAR